MRMIDFKNGTYVKLKKTNPDSLKSNIDALLIDGEYNVQGLTGKKKDYTSLPYSKISVFSVETAGVLDLDSELEMYFSGLGKVRFEFTGASDIVEIGKVIGMYALN